MSRNEPIVDRRLERAASRLPTPLLPLLGLMLIAAIASVEYFIGSPVSLAVVYLLPVAAVVWLSGSLIYGLALTAAAAAAVPLLAIANGNALRSSFVAGWNGIARFLLFVVVVLLILRLRRLLAEHKDLARTDALTGLANAGAFRERCAMEIERTARCGRPTSIAYIDIDDFKVINDVYGHSEGDRVLQAVATLARLEVRSLDTVARLGGDEFAVLLPETESAEACAPMRRLLASLPAACGRPHSIVGTTCSIGVATFARAPRSVDEMIDAADELMYEAKAKGKNRLCAETITAAESHLALA